MLTKIIFKSKRNLFALFTECHTLNLFIFESWRIQLNIIKSWRFELGCLRLFHYINWLCIFLFLLFIDKRRRYLWSLLFIYKFLLIYIVLSAFDFIIIILFNTNQSLIFKYYFIFLACLTLLFVWEEMRFLFWNWGSSWLIWKISWYFQSIEISYSYNSTCVILSLNSLFILVAVSAIIVLDDGVFLFQTKSNGGIFIFILCGKCKLFEID